LVLSDIFLFAAIVMFLYIAWQDFMTLRIRNVHVGILTGFYALFALASGFDQLVGDLSAGALLFGISFVFWLFRAIGAGDVKLYFPLGLFVGFDGLMPYAVFLMVFSLIILALIKIWGRFSKGRTLLGRRFAEIRAGGNVPYGVPMGLSAILVMVAERLLIG